MVLMMSRKEQMKTCSAQFAIIFLSTQKSAEIVVEFSVIAAFLNILMLIKHALKNAKNVW